MTSRLIQLVESFGGHRVLLVGDLILDRYVYGDAERISPEAPVPVLRQQSQEERVGGAGSVAANLRMLGLDVMSIGAVGNDPAGERVRALLESDQINTRGVFTLADRPTTTKTRFIGLAQHRHRQQLIRVDDEVTRAVTDGDGKRLIALVESVLSSADVVCLEDYEKGLLTPLICQEVIRLARSAGKPVLVDPARTRDYGKYRGATLLTPNRSEFQIATGCADTSIESVRQAIPALLEQHDFAGILVTLDRDGSILAQRGDEPVHVPTRPRAVYDNTGAGDAVLAMLAAARAAGATWEEAARLTNIAGGLEVEKFGAVPITCDAALADLRLSEGSQIGKIRELGSLTTEIELRKTRGDTIVFTNGCFDILHAGHVRYLQSCRAHGDVVVVGLNSDASVRAQNKGADRPLVPQDQRAEVIAALACIDYVVIYDDPTPLSVIETLSPHVLIKGEDWRDKGVVGREHVEAKGGRVVLVPLVPGVSTTDIVERIRSTDCTQGSTR